MGSTPSKPLLEWTSQELAVALERLGSQHAVYAPTILDNGVDGALLYNFSDQEFAETLTDLNITNRLHCRVLTKEWNQHKKQQEPSTATPTSVQTGVMEDDDNDAELPMGRTSNSCNNNDDNTPRILSDAALMGTPPPPSSDHQSHPPAPTTTTTTTSKRRSNVSFQLDCTTTNDWAAGFHSSHGSTNEDYHHHPNNNNRTNTINHHPHPYGESYSGLSTSTTTRFQNNKRSSISDQLLRLHQSDTSLYTGVQILDPDGHMSLSSIYKPKDPFFFKKRSNNNRPRPQVQQEQVPQPQAQPIWTNHLFAAETENQVRLKEVLQQRNLVLASQIQKAKPVSSSSS
jgi:hypothetical protein